MNKENEAMTDDVKGNSFPDEKYWVMGTAVFHAVPKGASRNYGSPFMICKCETVDQAHAIRWEMTTAAQENLALKARVAELELEMDKWKPM